MASFGEREEGQFEPKGFNNTPLLNVLGSSYVKHSMKTLLLALVLSLGPDEKGSSEPPTPVLVRGEKLKGLPSVSLTKLLADPTEFDGKTVALEGKVRKACEKKGCWMELAGSEKGPGVRVTFKNYGFFVPTTSAGSTAKVEGVIKVATLDDARAKHYEAEGATVPKGEDGKYREVQLVAVGLELHK